MTQILPDVFNARLLDRPHGYRVLQSVRMQLVLGQARSPAMLLDDPPELNPSEAEYLGISGQSTDNGLQGGPLIK